MIRLVYNYHMTFYVVAKHSNLIEIFEQEFLIDSIAPINKCPSLC